MVKHFLFSFHSCFHTENGNCVNIPTQLVIQKKTVTYNISYDFQKTRLFHGEKYLDTLITLQINNKNNFFFQRLTSENDI